MRLNLYFTIFHYKQFRLLKLNAVLDEKIQIDCIKYAKLLQIY